MTHTLSIPPIERSIAVSWNQQDAFDRFTAGFAGWWPRATHSVGGHLVHRIVFECALNGRIYEELTDGRRYQWGQVTAWEPPHRVAFTWHPSEERSASQEVEVTFRAETTGSRVVLVSTGWEKFGAKGRRKRNAYNVGWGGVVAVFAGRTTPGLVVFGVISRGINYALRATGRYGAAVDKAGGRMPADSA